MYRKLIGAWMSLYMMRERKMLYINIAKYVTNNTTLYLSHDVAVTV